MSSSNRFQLSAVLETTLGVTPNTPRMRAVRSTKPSLENKIDFVDSAEIYADRMNVDPIKTIQAAIGSINGEIHFPVDNSPSSTRYMSVFCNAWVNTPNRDNDTVASSVISNINAGTQVVTVATGAAFVTGHMVIFTGFALAANNGAFKCTAGSATVPAFVGSGLLADAAPAAAARMKVCGFYGAASDITATATGLSSTILNFTTLGLSVGMWTKIGGTAVGDQFATVANNNYVRITAITATALTCDNLPIGWTVDAGTGKTIKVWFGDVIKNGTTVYGHTFEGGYLDHTPPDYIVYRGQVANTFDFSVSSRQAATWADSFMGMSVTASTTTLDAVTDPATTPSVMAGNANVGRLADSGSIVTSPNWAQDFSFQINNNLRSIEDVSSQSPVDIQLGECTVSGKLNTHFGSLALLNKFYAGNPSSLNSRLFKNNQAIIFDIPRVTYKAGKPDFGGKNANVMLSLDFTASRDTAIQAHILMNRMEYVESLN